MTEQEAYHRAAEAMQDHEEGVRILLVEDDPAIGRMVARGLATHGYEVVTAETGPDGLALATSEPVHLVLLDIELPGKDGHEVLAGIRLVRPDLPVAMLTARNDLSSKEAALAGGADAYLTKPFALAELLASIRGLTQRG